MRIAPVFIVFQAVAMATAVQAQAPAAQTAPAAQPAPAAATAPKIVVGAPVFDPKGGEVGTIASVSGEAVVVSTGTQKVTLAASTFAQWPKGLVIAMTRDELNAAATNASANGSAALEAALVPNAQVHSFGGSKIVGTIKALDTDLVMLTTAKGDVRLPRKAFVMGTAGLSVRMSAEQFETAIGQATTSEAANASDASAPTPAS